MFWTIVLIGAGINPPSITYIGNFEQQEACQVALKDLKLQTSYKVTCVQQQKMESAVKK
jgi:hypothetical protein